MTYLDDQITCSGIRIGDNPVSLHNLIRGSDSMHSVSIIFNNIAEWCNENCAGHWYWGWMTMRKDLASFYTHVCFDRSEDALMFRLSFPL